MENEENEKIDKITGQKESEIPVFKQELPKYQHVYFIVTKLNISQISEEVKLHEIYEPSCEVIGLFSDGIGAREKMDQKILDDGFFPSDVEYGMPEKVKIRKILNDCKEEVEYKISQVLVDK